MIKTHGIIIGIIPYSESSLILKVQSRDIAHVSIIAKGWRKKPDPLLRFCEYEFGLFEPKEEGLYLLKEADLLQDYSRYPTTSTWAAAEAGAELISKILIPASEAQLYYEILQKYLVYLQKLETNGILIFWRLFMRLLKLMGIEPDLSSCGMCGEPAPAYAFNGSAEIICRDCYVALNNREQYYALSRKARDILALLPEIGMHLCEAEPSQEVVGELNRLFLAYYTAHQKQTPKLKSLSVLSQFYN